MLSFFFSTSLNSIALGLTRMGSTFIKLSELQKVHWLEVIRPTYRLLAFLGLVLAFFAFALVFAGVTFTSDRPRGYIVWQSSHTSTLHHISSSVAMIFNMQGLPHSGHLLMAI